MVAVGGVDDNGQRHVYFELNGHPRETTVNDFSAPNVEQRRRKATPGDSGHIASSMPGKIIKVHCRVGRAVKCGDTLLVTEAMKMETSVTAPSDGIITELFIGEGDRIEGGDLLGTIREE